MGDIADMMLDGILCEMCGVLMDDLRGRGDICDKDIPGYPRRCEECKDE